MMNELGEPITQIRDIVMLQKFIQLQRANKRKNDYFDNAFHKRLSKK